MNKSFFPASQRTGGKYPLAKNRRKVCPGEENGENKGRVNKMWGFVEESREKVYGLKVGTIIPLDLQQEKRIGQGDKIKLIPF